MSVASEHMMGKLFKGELRQSSKCGSLVESKYVIRFPKMNQCPRSRCFCLRVLSPWQALQFAL